MKEIFEPIQFMAKRLRLFSQLLLSLLLIICLASTSQAQNNPYAIAELSALSVSTGALDAVAFSPDGKIIATGGRDNLVRLWDTSTGSMLASYAGHQDWVTSVAFSPDGKYLASGARDHQVRLWDVAQGTLIRLLDVHTDSVTSLAFTPDSTILASGSRDSMIHVAHIESGGTVALLENYGGPVWDIAFNPDGTMLASAGEDGSIWLWGLWDEGGVWLSPIEAHTGPVVTLSFRQNGNWLLSGGLDGLIHMWDIRSPKTAGELNPITFKGHIAPVMGLGLSADGLVGVSASLDGTIRLWDVGGTIQRGKELAAIQGTGIPLTNLILSESGTTAASVSTDGMLRLWDVGAETLNTLIDSQRPALIERQAEKPDESHISTETAPAPQFPAAAGPMLIIPSANIYSPVTTFYLDGTSWGIDPWEPLVGHLQGTAWLNTGGNMVFGGHSEYPNGRPGIFASLYNVHVGDEITVQEGDVQRRYVVTEVKTVSYDDLSVVYPTNHSRLTLITCDIPSFEPQSNFYAERLIVIADAVN